MLGSLRREHLAARRILQGLIEGGDWTPAGTTTEDGQRYVVIEADGVESATALREGNVYYDEEATVETFSGEGLVTEDGVVREIRVTITFDGRAEDGIILLRTTDVGETSVSRPDWTATAKQKATEFETEVVDGGTYITLSHVGGQSIQGRFEVDVAAERDYFDGELGESEDFDQGTTLYLYRTNEQEDFGRVLGVSKGSPPDSPPPEDWSGEVQVNVWKTMSLHRTELRI
jgi:hypothetical protein